MKVIEPGHVYALDHLDGPGQQRLVFVNREAGTAHEGTQNQEVLRATVDVLEVLIDRVNHCDACLRWEGNDRIVKCLSEAQRQLRLALLIHEQRALERKLDRGALAPETIPVSPDGHWGAPSAADVQRLWAHLVSKHAVIVPPTASFTELLDLHRHEHQGPGTIRNHDEASREYSVKRLGEVLSEAEE